MEKTFSLKHPVQFGKDELVAELTLKPTAKAFRGLKMTVKGDESMTYEPFELAAAGVRMANRPSVFLESMHPEDMQNLAVEVLGFLGSGPETGNKP